MKKITILLLFLFTLQGCSVILQKKESIKLPTNISNPSVLIKQGQYISLLEMDGKQIKLTKVSSSKGFESYQSQSKFYFTMQTFLSIDSSLWVFDQKDKILQCLIPQIPDSITIQNMKVTMDQSYFIFSTMSKSNEIFDISYDYHIYSIKENQEMHPNNSSDRLIDIRETNQPKTFLIVCQKGESTGSEKQEISFWNIETKEVKKALIIEDDHYTISQNNKWLAAYINESLILYSLENGKKEILKEKIPDCDFEFVGTKPYLLVREYDFQTDWDKISYVSLDNQWNNVVLEPNDRITFFRVVRQDSVVFTVENKKEGLKKLELWNPDTKDHRNLYKSKNIELYFDRVTDTGIFAEFKGKDEITGKYHFLVLDISGKIIREFENEMEIAYPVSNDDSIWLLQKDDTFKKSKVKDYIVYNWKEEKEYPLTVKWSGEIYPIHASNDGQYIVFHAYRSSFLLMFWKKTIVMEIKAGKKKSIPKVGNFETITWLD